jgi:hypothetical protein
MLELSQPQTFTKNDGEYYAIFPCTGRTRTYTFSIDAFTPVRTMTKRELAAQYFPDEPKGELARKALYYELLHARQPAERLSDDDQALARDDGNVYLSDVLRDISPIDTAQRLAPTHVAAILHFLGPPPDREDVVALAA